MEYKYYGHENSIFINIKTKYEKINNPNDLYVFLNKIWCENTCAPRLRYKWNNSNKTLGQCSITSFLFQDLFGGEVHGILLEDGNYHCFNIIDNYIFDLTSEQFNNQLSYINYIKQNRSNHFIVKEKYERYLLLKDKLEEILNKNRQ